MPGENIRKATGGVDTSLKAANESFRETEDPSSLARSVFRTHDSPILAVNRICASRFLHVRSIALGLLVLYSYTF